MSSLGREPVTALALTKGQIFFSNCGRHAGGLSVMDIMFKSILVKMVHAINVIKVLNFF